VQVMALGYHFNMYRNKPLLRKGGVMIITHPCFDEFDPKFHPSYIEFFHRLLPESRDAFYLREKYEREFAENPAYIEMYRRGNAYHGAHAFLYVVLGRKRSPARRQSHRRRRGKRPRPRNARLGTRRQFNRSDCDGAFVSGQKRRDYDAASADYRAL
jgi:hypothetical protein